jgi:hypothetical protein
VYVTKNTDQNYIRFWESILFKILHTTACSLLDTPTRRYVREITQAQSTAGQAIRYLPPEHRNYKSQLENGRLLSQSPTEDKLL